MPGGLDGPGHRGVERALRARAALVDAGAEELQQVGRVGIGELGCVVPRLGGRHQPVGDGELDEGNIYEALLEGWKHDLRNTWWVIDYNRQSLDGVVTEGLRERIDDIFTSMGWQVVTIKYGHKLQAAFAKPGGARLRQWIDDCPNDLYAALCFEGGEAWREHLSRDLTDAPKTRAIIDGLDDAELADLMTNLGGHDLTAVLDAFAAIDHDRPVCFVAYTVKGYGLPLAGHKDNHAGLMTPAQIAALQGAMAVPAGAEWVPPHAKKRAIVMRRGLAPPILVVLAHRHLWAKLVSQLATSMRIVILARTASLSAVTKVSAFRKTE